MIRLLVLAVGSVAFLWALWGTVVTLFIAGWRRPRAAGVWWFKDRRSKRLVGTEDLYGAWCYVHWFLFIPVYSGQTVNMAARMRSEGHEIMALFFTHTLAIGCRSDELDTVERFLIRALGTRWFFNRTRGNR